MDKGSFLGHLVLLADATNKDLSDGLIALWWAKFGQHEEATFAAAVGLATDRHTFFPAPAEFAAILESLLTPEERSVQEGIRLLRSWVARGVLPPARDAAELAAMKAALGLPPPTTREVARLEAWREAVRLACADGHGDWAALAALPPGPVAARLLGVDRPALASGREGW